MYTIKTNPYTLVINDPTDVVAVFNLAPQTTSLFPHTSRYDISSATAACGSLQKTLIYSPCATLGIGCQLYQDDQGQVTAPGGFYSDGVTYYTVDKGGVIVSVDSCTPPTTILTYNCVNNTCVEVNGPGGTYPSLKGCLSQCGCNCTSAGMFVGGATLQDACSGTATIELYTSTCNPIFFTNSNCTSAFTGYIKQGVAINYYSNGVMVSTTSCPPPTPTPSVSPVPSATPVVTPGITPSLSSPLAPVPSPSPIVWRDCITGNLNTGNAPGGFREVVYSGPGGGTCWEPITELGFNPELSSAFMFTYQRGSANLPQPKSATAINPSYGKSYKVTITTNDMVIVTPSAFTLSPRSQQVITVKVTPELLDALGDGTSELYMDVDIEEV